MNFGQNTTLNSVAPTALKKEEEQEIYTMKASVSGTRTGKRRFIM
jgi:hypothetical protein